MNKTRKTGFFIIIVFTILLGILIFNHTHFIKIVFIFSVLGISVMIPFGAALVSLKSKKSRRERTKKVYLICSLIVILLGVYSKFKGVPGAAVELILGILFYCFAFAPLELKSKYERWKPYSKSKFEILLLSTIDFVGINLIALGFLFKFQYWPGAISLFVIGCVITFVGFLSWNYKFKKQIVFRKEAEDKIQSQFQEIKDSINYAKRIQSAILPPNKLVKEYLSTSFIHYKPKDIVAGDFYWMEPTKDGVLFAAADCTGHGVPGAMVSVVCNNGLNRSVREFGLTDPGQILNKTREIVIQEFEKSEDEVKDGMDIALCKLSGNILEYAGAHNPLWIIRKGASEVEEIKANKQPIGKFLEPKPYTTHKLKLNQGDSIYIFSDGYPDQFGGKKGKKFKTANFKKLLLSIQNETMELQEKILDQNFEEWKGALEQIDDVCIIGVKI